MDAPASDRSLRKKNGLAYKYMLGNVWKMRSSGFAGVIPV
jgi:hypothetical protein